MRDEVAQALNRKHPAHRRMLEAQAMIHQGFPKSGPLGSQLPKLPIIPKLHLIKNL
jgi:hypothetical protein